MKKYRVFRALGGLDKAIKSHELVAVEYGADITSVTDKLIKAVVDDAEGLEKYQVGGWSASAYAPTPVESFRRVKRYAYEMMAVVYPSYGETNDLIDYGITEEINEE